MAIPGLSSFDNALRRAFHMGVVTALLALGVACSPIVHQRGYVPKAEQIALITPGTPRQSVIETLGSPSTLATMNDNTFYYITSTTENFAFFEPEVTNRQILAVYFDNTNQVERVAHYGVEDGVIFDFITRKTPTRGKEFSFLEQMFGNLGKFSAQDSSSKSWER